MANIPEARFSFGVNGHTIHGQKRKGVWRFRCPSCPELAAKYTGATSTEEAIAEFTRRFWGNGGDVVEDKKVAGT